MRMQLREALYCRSANPISAEAAARREAVNRLSEFLSHSELFGVEFANLNQRKGTSALEGWVGGETERILSWLRSPCHQLYLLLLLSGAFGPAESRRREAEILSQLRIFLPSLDVQRD